MFENKIKINQTYTSVSTTSMFCPTCRTPMLLCQYFGGGFYWRCYRCGSKVERTGF